MNGYVKELDQDWIFNLRFLLISLVEKRIDVVPPIPGRESSSEFFDKVLRSSDSLGFFLDFLRRAELTNSDPNATREGWLNELCESLRIFKRVYRPTNKSDKAALDDAFSLLGTICAKKNFALPTRKELTDILNKEGFEVMVRSTWLLSDEERAAAISEGERNGEIRGKREGKREGIRKGKRDLLAQMIRLRFPTATPAFIKKILTPFSDSYVKELTSVMLDVDAYDEFKKRALALATGC